MTTHDPLVIGGLTKEEIRIFQSKKAFDKDGKEYQQIETFEPDFDPKGLGVAGILTSDLFKLPSTLDEDTLNLIYERNELLLKRDEGNFTEEEKIRLQELFNELLNLGINHVDRDPMYEKFLIAYTKEKKNVERSISTEDNKVKEKIAHEILKNLLENDKK